ncbi:hypothetical protein V6N12_061440 [Hibiscus sabdariffa]|uniref:DUF4283 domain-containing protein n=1 Tax=Hibiscus sabdariffa TaxID=183260 RepID=A0ABR2DXE4_9ROSI
MKIQVKPTISKNVAPSEKPHHSPLEEFVVEGIINKGVLEKLKSCMVGTTINIFNAEKLIETLESKGLREFDVRQIARNQFLIDFDREEKLSHCLKWEFQWLSDIISNIVRWNEEFSPGSRQTWVAIQGVPVFAWNNFTFNNLLNRWGIIMFLEDEELLGRDFAVKRAKILTNSMSFIDENVSLLCNGSFYPIKLREIDIFSWSPALVVEDPSKKGDLDGCYGVSGDSESKCSDENLSSFLVNVFSGQIKNLDSLGRSRDGKKLEIADLLIPTKVDMHEDFVGGCSLNLEAANSMAGPEADLLIVGDQVNDSKHTPSCSSKPHAVAPCVVEKLLSCSENIDNNVNNNDVGYLHELNSTEVAEGIFQQDLATAQSVGGVVSSQPFGVGRAADPQFSLIVAESLLSGSPLRVDLDAIVSDGIVSKRALEDVQAMGLLNDNIVEECEMVSNYNDISWAARVDMANGNMEAIERDEACKDDQTSFFPELQDHQFRRKFISSAELQDQFLSTKEKKKRDRALKKFKKAGQAVAPKEAEVHIPTDSNIARYQIRTKSTKNKFESRNSDMKLCDEGLYEEAKKALELGKSLRMQIIGNEEEAVEEMIRLELLRE